jgi:hypothetical protein
VILLSQAAQFAARNRAQRHLPLLEQALSVESSTRLTSRPIGVSGVDLLLLLEHDTTRRPKHFDRDWRGLFIRRLPARSHLPVAPSTHVDDLASDNNTVFNSLRAAN